MRPGRRTQRAGATIVSRVAVPLLSQLPIGLVALIHGYILWLKMFA